MGVEEKINKMARLAEKGAGKAPRCNNAGNRTAAAYRRAQAAKVRTRQKPDMAHLLEIRKYQKASEMLSQKAPFQHLVREFILKKGDIRVTLGALIVYQDLCEVYLAKYFQDFNLANIRASRVTIKEKDFIFVRSIRHEYILFNSSTPESVDSAAYEAGGK
jgi:histone H3/H4